VCVCVLLGDDVMGSSCHMIPWFQGLVDSRKDCTVKHKKKIINQF